MRRHIIYQLITFLIVGLGANLAPIYATEGETPKMYEVAIEVSPTIQGINGTQTVRASVGINGTC